MKKLTAVVIVVCILLSLPAPVSNTKIYSDTFGEMPESSGMTEVEPFDYSFLPASAKWLELNAFEKPATLHATYELADDVLVLQGSQNVTKKIASAGQLLSGSTVQKLPPNEIIAEGGYVPADILDAAAAATNDSIKNGTIVVDESTGTAFKVVSPTTYTGVYDADNNLQNSVKPLEGTYSITQPSLNEVVKNFNLPGQTVSLTRSNITDFAPNIESSVVNPSQYKLLSADDDFKYLSDNPLIALKFDKVKLEADLGDGLSINVTVSGGLGIDSMDLTGRYSGFDGYEIAMKLDQECDLDVTLDIKIKQEIRIPLYGFNVSFGVGSISGGIFAILGLDGILRLQIESSTFTSVTQGVHGGTFLYVPTSALPIFDPEIKVDGDVALSGQIDGYIKFGPMVNLELFGFDLVGVGIFLGAGVHVGVTLKTLDIELYALFNVYITLVGKTLNLANFKPTILTRHQADTGGYRVKIMEAYVKPGRSGGTIEMETDDVNDEDGYVPAANIPYRILAVPKGQSFNPVDMSSINNNAAIRKYPASGYAVTNNEGEFIQKDDNMLFYGDKAYLEFQANGTTYFSDPLAATLPFEKITITYADYFNDYVTGQVQPVRLINWDSAATDPAEQRYEWVYYNSALAYVQPKQWDAYSSSGWIYGGKATCRTDEFGRFDTRWIFNGNGLAILNKIDVRPSDWPNLVHEEFDVTLDDHDAILTRNISNINPTMSLLCNRVVNEVEGSYKRTEQNGQIIDQIMYDEYIWLINPSGTRTVTQNEFDYSIWGFSTMDSIYRNDDTAISNAIAALTGNNKWSTPPIIYTKPSTKTLTTLLDANGNESGTALFSQRVTAQWVWQAYPDPVKITSPDNTEASTKGGSFQVTATGHAPFTYSLKGAPSGIVIVPSTGLITIPAGMEEKTYSFTIQAKEDRFANNILHIAGTADPYEGNDPPQPAEQKFTLTVKGNGIISEPSKEPSKAPSIEPSTVPSTNSTAESSAGPTSEAEHIAPVINSASHGYQFSMTAGSGDMFVSVTATGSTPITWSLMQYGERAFPKEITIDPDSGLLTVSKNIIVGTYVFLIKAKNDAGSDTQECRLDVLAPRTMPVIAAETNNYVFTKLEGTSNLTVPIKAAGSTPITWSLERTGRYIIPSQVTIDPKTGILTVNGGIGKGTYYFTVKASNDIGSDSQACTLKVISLVRTFNDFIKTDLPFTVNPMSYIKQLAVAPATKGLMPPISQPVMPSLSLPANSVTLRCDHSVDVYTNDRFTINGAPYIRWDSIVSVSADGGVYRNRLTDNSPVCDNYHYSDPIVIPGSVKEKILNSLKEKLTQYQHPDILHSGEFSAENMLKEVGNFTENPFQNGLTYLEYGSLLDDMKSQKGGIFKVDLNKETGANITGKYFLGLKDNKSAKLSFVQDNMTITFAGKDIKTDANTEFELYNFAYTAGAPHETAMLSACGSGGNNFIFSFAHHGELPGIATITVKTALTEGTQVNIYKFNEATNKFTQITGNLAVGKEGVITYKNDTMSEYLVTTKKLANAVLSEAAGIKGFFGKNFLLFIAIGFAMIFSGIIAWIILRRKKKRRIIRNGV
ncbi:MAG: hypothetical protein ACYCYI_03995 [Saccharofermentanales bacterium]